MAENQVQSEKKMTSLNVSSETRDAIKDISTSLGLSQADTCLLYTSPSPRDA